MVWWNPLRSWFERRERLAAIQERMAAAARAERADERAAFLATVQSMAVVTERAFDANRAQHEAFKSFLDGFKTTTSPTARPYDEEAEMERYAAERAARGASTTADRIMSFEKMLAEMDEM